MTTQAFYIFKKTNRFKKQQSAISLIRADIQKVLGFSVKQMTIKELKVLIDEFEKNGKHCMGVNLPENVATELRRELHQMYGIDPGMNLSTLFGIEVLSIDFKNLTFEE